MRKNLAVVSHFENWMDGTVTVLNEEKAIKRICFSKSALSYRKFTIVYAENGGSARFYAGNTRVKRYVGVASPALMQVHIYDCRNAHGEIFH